jgi:hypothetical protein
MSFLPRLTFTIAGRSNPAANRKEIDDAYPG